MNGQSSLKQYLNNPIKYTKQKITDDKGNYSIYVPNNWNFSDNFSDYSLVFWHSIFREKDNKTIAEMEIVKIKDNKDLKTLFNSYLNPDIPKKILASGESDLLIYPSYFIHSVSYLDKSSNENNNTERIEFFIKSKQKKTFYIIRLSVKGEKQKENMSKMLQCLKTFEILK
ncbi:hypothetical protein SAMN02927937_00512 [Paenimyroides aquimaris]|uniref:PsbP C-terminal domain-containing protein n=1 Tax=Paenimyroides marinum TaxID=1159016 RepID=A0A1H6JIQ2_9FLAO|nr:hypothetical protein [Paenimyroides aquimaris]SEH61847.1 hypothetical protein SAMN02927937_00512 [Paenimyroides aquimaris]